jgi:phytoene synthase
MSPAERGKLAILAGRLARLAQAYESSARVGAARLTFRSRWAVLSAARIYGAIAQKVAERGARAWESRTVVPKAEKLQHVLAAGREALAKPTFVDRSNLWTRPR